MQPSFLGSLKNIGIGLFKRTAAFAGYGAATPTATTAQGSRIGTNPNSTYASVQRVGMQFTAEMVAKNSAIGAAYLAQRVNYCSSVIDYVPNTGDTGLDREIRSYLQGDDGVSGYFGNMGVDCSMQDAFSRTADIETPVRGDAGLIFWRDSLDNLRLIEFSADQLGEVYNFTMPRACSLSRDAEGMLYECSGSDCIYFAGRYFRGADCVAYKIYERTNAWYGSPRIYDADDVIYFRDPASFRGVRGVTKFANALLHMQKGEDMLQAALSAAQRQARTAGRVFNNSGGPADGYGSEIMAGDPALGGNTIKYFEREPGGPMIEYFYNGDSAEFVNPSAPGPELISGVEVNDERVAIALGLSYTFLINGGKASGAIARLDIEKSTKELNRIQRTIHRPRLNVIRDRALLDALRKGEIKKPFGMPRSLFLRGHWQLPVPPNVDAFYDVQKNIAMVRAGMEAPQDIIAKTNRNWEDVITKTTQWAAKASMARQDANATLAKTISPITGQPYKPDIQAADIAQVSDNPSQQPAPETQPSADPQQQPNAQSTAAMAAPHDVSHEKRDASGKWTAGGGEKLNPDIPGRTIHGVESLREHLRPEAHADLVSALNKIHGAGFHVPAMDSKLEVKGFQKERGNNWMNSPARISHENLQRTLEINPAYFRLKDHRAKIKEAYDAGYTSTDLPEHIFIHELGHALAGHLQPNAGDIFGEPALWEDAEKRIAGEVSRRAMKDPGEFIAETFAGKVSGKKYSKDVEGLYSHLRGPQPSLPAAALAAHDVSHEKRDASGKWTTGGGGDSKEEEHHRSPSDFRAFKVQKISKESVLEHLKKHGWKPGDTLEHEKGHAEIYNPKPYNNIEGEHNGHTVDVAWRPKVGKPNEFRLYLDKGVKIPAPALQYQSKLIPSIVHERPNPMLSVAPKLASNSTDATAAMAAPHDVSNEKRDASGKWTSGGGQKEVPSSGLEAGQIISGNIPHAVHATGTGFDSFDIAKAGSQTGNAASKKGIFFGTPDNKDSLVDMYATDNNGEPRADSRIIHSELNLKNAKVFEVKSLSHFDRQFGADSHDGDAIGTIGGKPFVYVIRDPSRIKISKIEKVGERPTTAKMSKHGAKRKSKSK